LVKTIEIKCLYDINQYIEESSSASSCEGFEMSGYSGSKTKGRALTI
jgi:hypothetical protein